jgi:threonine synthase
MHLIQAAGSSPIVNAFESGTLHVHPVEPNTIAKSIAIGNPADGYYALRTARESGGTACAVADEEIVYGIGLLAQTEGIFAETASGAVIAGLRKMVKSGVIKRHHLTVVCITGAGLKTQEVVSDDVQLTTIQPTLESFEKALGKQIKKDVVAQ